MRRVDLAESILLTASGITRLLEGLERSGLVGAGALRYRPPGRLRASDRGGRREAPRGRPHPRRRHRVALRRALLGRGAGHALLAPVPSPGRRERGRGVQPARARRSRPGGVILAGMTETKITLPESAIPERWYNIAADMPNRPQPVLHPGTGEPVGPDDLAPLFPMDLILQEVSTDARDRRSRTRSATSTASGGRRRSTARSGSSRRSAPARASSTSTRASSPAGSHKPNTAVAQAYYVEGVGPRRASPPRPAPASGGARSRSPRSSSASSARSTWSRSRTSRSRTAAR